MRSVAITLATLIGAGALVVAAGGQTPSSGPSEVAQRAVSPSEGLTNRQLVGQRLVCGFSGRRASESLLRYIEGGQLAGVILFDRNIGSRAGVRRLSRAIQATNRPPGLRQPVLISIDQEGGQVKRLAGPPRYSAEQMGRRGARVARAQGRATGRSLAGVGINVDLAPVLDVPRPGGFIAEQDRGFSRKPGRAGRIGTAFGQGLQQAGVAGTAKHFPGLGSTADNTDLRPSTIRLPGRRLRAVDERPYERWIAFGGDLVMISSARYPALGGRLPASQDKRIATAELRGRLGFDGVSISDSLETPGARAGAGPAKVAIRTAAAGTDLLLYVHCDAAVRAANALRRALASGRLDRERFRASVDRVLALRGSLARR